MIKVGQQVLIDPFKDIRTYGLSGSRALQVGDVIYVNKPHRWFGVEYGEEDVRQRISYKFADINETVKIITK